MSTENYRWNGVTHYEYEPETLEDTPVSCLFDDPAEDDWEWDWKSGLAIHPNSPKTWRRRN